MSKDNRILIICILRFRRTVNLNHCNSTYLRHCRMLYLHVGIHPFLNDVCLFNQRRKVFWTDINAEVIRVYEQSKISAIGNVEFNFTELGNISFNVAVKKERRNVDYRDRLCLAMINLNPSFDQTDRALKSYICIRLFCLDESGLNRDSTCSNRTVPAHVYKSVTFHKYDTQIGFGVTWWENDRAEHVSMAARLKHQRRSNIVVVLFKIVLFLHHGVAGHIRNAADYNASGFTHCVRINRINAFYKSHLLLSPSFTLCLRLYFF